jgi:excinuclease UvrABC ATPase subunit
VDTENIDGKCLEKLTEHYGIDLDTPIKTYPKNKKSHMDGINRPSTMKSPHWDEHFSEDAFIEGISDLIERRYRETSSSYLVIIIIHSNKHRNADLVWHEPISQALSVRVGCLNIHEFSQ